MNFWAKKRKGDLVFESNLVLSQRGIRAMPHAIPQTHSSVYCFYPHRFKSEIHVFLFIESWSRDQLMQKDLLLNLTWKLAIFRQEGIFNTFGFTFHVCHLIGFKMTSLITCRRRIRRKTWNKQKLVGNFWLYFIT